MYAPRSDVESIIYGIWVELLGHQQIDIDDHFFHVGGHSLLAMRLMTRISSRFRVEIPLSDFLEKPTIAALAEMVKSLVSLTQKPDFIPEDYDTGEI